MSVSILHRRPASIRAVVSAAVLVIACGPAASYAEAQAVPPTAKRRIAHDAYATWKSIAGTTISADGQWVAYELNPQEGDGDLVVRSTTGAREHRQPRGRAPVFSDDGRFVVFTVAPLFADVQAAKKAKKKPEDGPKSGAGVLDLESGRAFVTERIKRHALAKRGSLEWAYVREEKLEGKSQKGEADERKKEKEEGEREKKGEGERTKVKGEDEAGTDLVIRLLATGEETVIPHVREFAWSDDGEVLAYTTSAKDGSDDGAFVRRRGAAPVAILTGAGRYPQIAVDRTGGHVAVVTDRDEYPAEAAASALYRWTGRGMAARVAGRRELPQGFAVSPHRPLTFANDGDRLFFGYAPVPVAPTPESDVLKVDLWHWKDPRLQTVQKAAAERDRTLAYVAVANRRKEITPIGTPSMPDVQISRDGRAAIGRSNLPYQIEMSWNGETSDVYAVDLSSGASRRVAAQLRHAGQARVSPDGTWVVYYDDQRRQWHSARTRDGRTVRLAAFAGDVFADEQWDTPQEARPYGVAGWSADGNSVYLYDRFDIWEAALDGRTAHSITNRTGRRDRMRFRYIDLDPEADTWPTAGPWLLSAVNQDTYAEAVYRLVPGRTPTLEPLMVGDEAIGTPVKASRDGRVVFTRGRADRFPDLWTTPLDMAAPVRLSDANPQQQTYVWPRAQLVDFVNADGVPLKGVLYTPEDFDPTRRYPLLVYIYERLSQTLHAYTPPAPGTSINITRYVSNGYLVLKPDIVYERGYPGESAYKCVLPAVQSLVARGFVDPERIGIQGHSWGGYQISYLITRTTLFRAVEAGASVANMTSAYGGIRWGTGLSRAFQYERTQSRIGGPPWASPLQFLENSPLFWADKVQTPYLTIHNDEDDAVPWTQGIEFFTALRRLGKEAYLFNYNGEKHGLREREAQKHWTVHMAEFFDHYLLDGPRPDWMTRGVPYLQRGTRDLSPFYGKPPAAASHPTQTP